MRPALNTIWINQAHQLRLTVIAHGMAPDHVNDTVYFQDHTGKIYNPKPYNDVLLDIESGNLVYDGLDNN